MASKVTLGDQLLFPSDYLAAFDLRGRDMTLTIASISKQELQLRTGGKKVKPVITFKETEKKVVLNVTNAESISIVHGPKAESWVGKQVTFYPTKTQAGRDTVDCIRVREVGTKEEAPPPDPEEEAALSAWQAKIDADPTLDQLNAMVGEIRGLEEDVKKKVWIRMLKATKQAGLTFDRKANVFVLPAPKPDEVPA